MSSSHRKRPAATEAESDLQGLGPILNQVFDEKRVCVIGVPMDWDEERLKKQVRDTVYKATQQSGGVHAIVSSSIIPPKQHHQHARGRGGGGGGGQRGGRGRGGAHQQQSGDSSFQVGFVAFSRPEGADTLIETIRKVTIGDSKTELRDDDDNNKGSAHQSRHTHKQLTFKRPQAYKKLNRPYNSPSEHVKTVPHTLSLSGTKGGLRNLQFKVTDADFVHALEHFGPIVGFVHKRDSEGLSIGRALVDFRDTEAAEACRLALDGSDMVKPPNLRWQVVVEYTNDKFRASMLGGRSSAVQLEKPTTSVQQAQKQNPQEETASGRHQGGSSVAEAEAALIPSLCPDFVLHGGTCSQRAAGQCPYAQPSSSSSSYIARTQQQSHHAARLVLCPRQYVARFVNQIRGTLEDIGCAGCPFGHWLPEDLRSLAFLKRFKFDLADRKWLTRSVQVAPLLTVTERVGKHPTSSSSSPSSSLPIAGADFQPSTKPSITQPIAAEALSNVKCGTTLVEGVVLTDSWKNTLL